MNGLGWGPMKTSGVFGASFFVVFAHMCLVMALSKYVADIPMVAIGNVLWVIGGSGIYYWWTDYANAWEYIVPVMISCSGFPWIAASNRSLFTKAVNSKPELDSAQGMMQAVLSMAASVAGFL
jgi:hypothetical protein